MDEHYIPSQWIDVQEDAEAREVVMKLSDGKRIIATIILEDYSLLVEQSKSQLARKLGIDG